MERSISFVICFHPSRIDNLQQTLRLLKHQEPKLASPEIVLVCQSWAPPLITPFQNTTIINCGFSDYRKAMMTNRGVKLATGDVIVLLDGDRAVTESFFHLASSQLGEDEVRSVFTVNRLLSREADEKIAKNSFSYSTEDRCTNNEAGKKNLFSGNTIMWRSDFLKVGGMDESYIGYGFLDNDMTRTIGKSGLKPIFYVDQKEKHFYHPANIEMCGKMVMKDIGKISCAVNALRYCRKWQIKPDTYIRKLVASVAEDVKSKSKDFPDEYLKEFINFYWKGIV